MLATCWVHFNLESKVAPKTFIKGALLRVTPLIVILIELVTFLWNRPISVLLSFTFRPRSVLGIKSLIFKLN